MRKHIFLSLVLVLCAAEIFSQNKKSVVIGTKVDKPNALLVLNPPDGNQGVILPQLTTAQRISIQPQSPLDEGLLVFDTDVKAFYYWKDNAWNKGLGNDTEHQAIQYDAATNHLTLNLNGGDVDLSALKEIPDITGQAGKFITTNGSSIAWVALPSGTSTLTGITAGAGLTGGGTTGAVNVAVQTDNTTIIVDTNNAVSLKDGAVTAVKLAANAVTTQVIQPGSANTILTTDNTGVVKWLPPVVGTDNQTLALTGNSLQISNGNAVTLIAGGQVTGPLNNVAIGNGVVTSAHIVDGTIASADIKDNTITTNDIASGGVNKALMTDATGAVVWATPSISTDNQQLTYNNATQRLSLSNSTDADLSSLKELPSMTGNSGRFLTTNGTTSTWSDLIAGGQLSGPLSNLSINNNTLTSAMLVNGTVLPVDLSSGGNDKVLMTDATGIVNWGSKAGLLTGLLSAGSTAGGDLAGTYPNPLVANTAGNNVVTAVNNAATTNSITGIKVNPNFGTQNIITTGSLTANLSINTTGTMNVGGVTTLNGPAVMGNTVTVNGAVTAATLAGSGTRMVVANPSGVLTTQNIPAITTGNLTTSTTGVTITNGTNAVIGSGSSISIQTATTTQPGLLSSADYTTFNNKVGSSTTPAAGDISGSFTTGFQLGAAVVGDAEISTISPSKISQSGATTGQVLKWNGTAWIPQADTSIPALSANQIVTNDGTSNVARTISGDATFNGTSGALNISSAAGTNIITAVNNASTTGTINTNRLAPAVVLDSESPAAGAVGGTFAGGLTLTNNAVTTATIAPSAVDATKIKPGTSNQILVTDATGTNAQWVDQTSLIDGSATNELITNVQLSANTLTITEAGTAHTQSLNGVALTGDVTGTINTNKVTKIQGVAVSATPPTDQQILLYDNSTAKWVPTTVPGVSNFTAFKVAQNANQDLNGTMQLNWDAEIYDDGSNFSGNQFRAPSAGLYHFDVLITIQNMDKDNVMIAILRVGGTDIQRSIYTSGSKNNDASAQLSTDVKLNANDLVTVWIDIQGGKPGPGPGGLFTTQGGKLYTQFSGRRIY